MLDTYTGTYSHAYSSRKKEFNIICPKCGKRGFLAKRWVKGSSYFPNVSIHMFHDPHRPLPDNVRVYTPTGKFGNEDGHDYYQYSCVDKKTGKRLFVCMIINEGRRVKPKKRLFEGTMQIEKIHPLLCGTL